MTGGGSGLGKSNAIVLAKAVFSIMVTDINLNSAEKTKNEIMNFKGIAKKIKCDAICLAEINYLVEATMKKLARKGILLNSAGVIPE